MKNSQCRGYTLIEMLFVLAIVSLLAAIMMPVFGAVRGKAREVSCASNLRQIGQAFSMYMQDYDGRFPNAINAGDKFGLGAWSDNPSFKQEIPHLPILNDALQPYAASYALFRCPSDSGFAIDDFRGAWTDAFPTSYEKYGTSYYYRTELAARKMHESEVTEPAGINVLMDAAGVWHGTLTPPAKRYNVLFADSHVKNISRQQIEEAWQTPLTPTR